VKDLIEVAMTPNEAAQLVMSAGLIQPQRTPTVRTLDGALRGRTPAQVS
jgi:uncharacterized membrane protein